MGNIHTKESAREIALRNAPQATQALVEALRDAAFRTPEPVMLGLLLRAADVVSDAEKGQRETEKLRDALGAVRAEAEKALERWPAKGTVCAPLLSALERCVRICEGLGVRS
jgi:hypothetical protein